MRILIVGAGALGGYFGGRLLHAGRDVTFLVRPNRAEQIARDGLRISGSRGDFAVAAPIILVTDLRKPFDVIIIAVKSYSLDEATEHLAGAVGPNSAIIPVVNGMRHIDQLVARFGATRVMGGMAQISATLDPEGRVLLLFPVSELVLGELAGGASERTSMISAELGGAGFDVRASEVIRQDMWEKCELVPVCWTGWQRS
jgi:2-dehydropantoate 2-reductase